MSKGDIRYDRQERIIGIEAMELLKKQKILLIGLGGLGAEIAKNIILMGVQSITLWDDKNATNFDLSSQFILTEESVGKNRLSQSIDFLKKLNDSCVVEEYHGTLDAEYIKKFTVVIYTDIPFTRLVDVEIVCRDNGIKFVAAQHAGLCGAVFVDFGAKFTSNDIGLPECSGMISGIKVDENGIAEVNTEDPDNQADHNMTDQYSVVFQNVGGLNINNEKVPRKIERTGPYTFKIGSVKDLGDYTTGGYFTSVPVREEFKHSSLKENLENPVIQMNNFFTDSLNFLCFKTLGHFVEKFGKSPKPWNTKDAESFVSLAAELNFEGKHVSFKEGTQEFEADALKHLNAFANTACGNLNPMCTYLGALVAQEALKAATHKYCPISQFFLFDSMETLPDPAPKEEDCVPQDSRYDGQIAVFGSDFQDRIGNKKSFIVGAGALGCEYIKNYALMGISCGPKGKTWVTDGDTIDVSNLSRQFLFRQEHVKSFKSEVAAKTAQGMNSSLNIISLQDRVGPETENVFNDKFWDILDFVTNALDNVQARLYTDGKCVYYRKALFESGTLGTMANSQTVLPFETKTYGSYKDPPQKEIAKCTIHSFPNLIQHTISWARGLFENLFSNDPQESSLYLANSKEYLTKNAQNVFALETVYHFLSSKPKSFEECVFKARIKFEELFVHAIQNVLEEYPVDHKTPSGGDFWSGNKRCPILPKFDFKNFTHHQFIVSATKLYCDVNGFQFKQITDEEYISLCDKAPLPKFIKKRVVTEKEDKKDGEAPPPEPELTEEQKKKKHDYYENIDKQLKNVEQFSYVKVLPVEFEKDIDENLHMDFITGASNIRAHAYGIPEADKHRTKGIAGNIIPAMITTTALITGVVGFEILKYCLGKKKEAFRNSFNNIAHNTSQFSEPGAPDKDLAEKWTVWDRFEISEGKDITVEELLKALKSKYELDIIALSYGSTPLFILKPDEKILHAPVAKLCQHLSEEKFDSNKKFVELYVQALFNGKVTPVPSIKYQFKFDPKRK